VKKHLQDMRQERLNDSERKENIEKARQAKELAEFTATEAKRKAAEAADKAKKIAEDNARKAREATDAAKRKGEEKARQERIKQRRLLIKKGEPEIDYDELIDMKKSENQFFIIFFSSIVSFFILHWIISVSGICYAIFIYNKKVLQRLKEVFGQEICEKYNNSFQKLYAEYKDDVNEEKQ